MMAANIFSNTRQAPWFRQKVGSFLVQSVCLHIAHKQAQVVHNILNRRAIAEGELVVSLGIDDENTRRVIDHCLLYTSDAADDN